MKLLSQSPGQDALNDVLTHLYVRGAVYCRSDLRAPWAFSVAKKPTAGFHAVTQGEGWLEVKGEIQRIAVSRGDLIVLPHGHAHALFDSPKTPPTPLEDFVAQNPLEDGIRLRMGSRGAATVLLCGGFQFDGSSAHPLFANLPKVIHIRGEDGRPSPWVQSTLAQIERETRAMRPGAQALLARLSDVLFIQIMRAYFASQVDVGESYGWLGALKDPLVGMAITNIHRRPEQNWTVASLASQVGMSRSAFAAKFTRFVGEPPLRYLARWRVHKAQWLLRTSTEKLTEIAHRVGYESEIALIRAFRRYTGTTPGKFRRSSP